MNNWKNFAKLINAPYNKRFSTDGYGDFRIDNKGLYIYKNYKDDFSGYWHEDYNWNGYIMSGLLNGSILVIERI